jgi:hypothetical protein
LLDDPIARVPRFLDPRGMAVSNNDFHFVHSRRISRCLATGKNEEDGAILDTPPRKTQKGATSIRPGTALRFRRASSRTHGGFRYRPARRGTRRRLDSSRFPLRVQALFEPGQR